MKARQIVEATTRSDQLRLERERVYDVYTDLMPDVDIRLLRRWLPNLRKLLKKDILKASRVELIKALEAGGYFGPRSDSARWDADKYF
jgi:hypothetical protein